jgi:Tol biopolymer transport system component/serine/threonine protein kinase
MFHLYRGLPFGASIHRQAFRQGRPHLERLPRNESSHWIRGIWRAKLFTKQKYSLFHCSNFRGLKTTQDITTMLKNIPSRIKVWPTSKSTTRGHVGPQTISHYRIIKKLGAGGMGEVYLAEDTKLDRKVALKLLPDQFTSDESRLRRFVQEAKAASSLNHPNIITIHEIGQDSGSHFIATELIDGLTLRQQLASGRMSLPTALDIAIQAASALVAAHEAGIIHRDIKPENIMLRRDGYVKVLDFGLAKLTEAAFPSTNTEAPTVMRFESDPGTILGTAQYMSPEQARGLKMDARTDIFTLGVVIYEIVTGNAPFAGETTLDVMAAIINKEPLPLSSHLPSAPAELQRIVAKALRKDKEERYQTVKDLLIDLKSLRQDLELEARQAFSSQTAPGGSGNEAKASGDRATTAQVANVTDAAVARTTSSAEIIISEIKRHKLGALVILTALGAVIAAVAFGVYKMVGSDRPETPTTQVRPRPFTSFAGSEDQAAFSPDGKQIAFAWSGETGDNQDIYTKLVDVGAPLRLTTNPAPEYNPVWSPDGRFVAFLRQSSESSGVYLIPSLGGPERKLAETFPKPATFIEHCLDYSQDGKLLAISDKGSQLDPFSIFILSIETGEKRRLTSPPVGLLGDSSPAFSPDGKFLAFVRAASAGVFDIYIIPVAGGEPRRLTFDNTQVKSLAWTSGGREIVFTSWRGGSISNLWRISAAGGSLERVVGVGQRVFSPAISRQGDSLAYTQSLDDMNIWRLEVPGSGGRTGPPTRLISSTQWEVGAAYSPDGKRIVFASDRTGSWELWVSDSDGSNPIQLTSSFAGSPRWSADGRQIAFDARPQDNYDIYVISAEGGSPLRLTTEPSEDVAPSWSRDGRWIYFGSNRSGSMQIWKMPAEGGEAVQVTSQGGFESSESPDSRFLYYAKRNSPGIWKVPTEGGEETLVLDFHKAGFWRYWAMTDQGIYFATSETPSRPVIEFFSFATGQVTQIATLEKPIVQWFPGLAVSPDGRWILCAQLDQSGSDIILVENFR